MFGCSSSAIAVPGRSVRGWSSLGSRHLILVAHHLVGLGAALVRDDDVPTRVLDVLQV
jgi:hypothetical protein